MKLFYILLLGLFSCCWAEESIRIGSKRFTESYILGEILHQKALEANEASVDYRPGLGNTGIIFAALKEGAIDAYPEYTGTIVYELLKSKNLDLAEVRRQLNPMGLDADILFGFNNSYAIAMKKERADELNIRSISDLKKHPEIKMGFTQEFLKRPDGWSDLKQAYELPQKDAFGIDHSLSYEAMNSGQIDVTDVYTTDPKINEHNLVILEDDRQFFPKYEALILYRQDFPKRFPQTWKSFRQLQGTIDHNTMLKMNAEAELKKHSFTDIAQQFLNIQSDEQADKPQSFLEILFGPDLWTLTKQHLWLVFGSLIPAIVVGIALGILAANFTGLSHLILGFVGIVQTIPALALLAFLIPLLQQIGTLPALIALFFYALLPIVRGTYAGLTGIASPLKESAAVLNISPIRRLGVVELPLAANSILSGIKTAAVINVGMATIAAFIGGGGYGERIVTGLALNDYRMLLAGAIPSCAMAILFEFGFDILDYLLIPKGLKVNSHET